MNRALIALLLGAAVSDAGSITYDVARTVGAGTVTGTIETDGSLGVLNTSNITDWDLQLFDGSITFTLTGPLSGNNSSVLVSGSNFTASATQLLFDFSGASSGYVLFQDGLFSGQHYYCDQTISGPCLVGESDIPGSVFNSTHQVITPAGPPVIGTASGTVPEPGTCALVLAGLAPLTRKRTVLAR